MRSSGAVHGPLTMRLSKGGLSQVQDAPLYAHEVHRDERTLSMGEELVQPQS